MTQISSLLEVIGIYIQRDDITSIESTIKSLKDIVTNEYMRGYINNALRQRILNELNAVMYLSRMPTVNKVGKVNNILKRLLRLRRLFAIVTVQKSPLQEALSNINYLYNIAVNNSIGTSDLFVRILENVREIVGKIPLPEDIRVSECMAAISEIENCIRTVVEGKQKKTIDILKAIERRLRNWEILNTDVELGRMLLLATKDLNYHLKQIISTQGPMSSQEIDLELAKRGIRVTDSVLRNALAKLEDNGYIITDRNKRPYVYKWNPKIKYWNEI